MVFTLAACGGASGHPAPHVTPRVDSDPQGLHEPAVTAQIQPFIDGEIASGVVVGLIDQGKTEIYGFGKGPGGAKPTGKTLFEIGSATKIYTSLLLADAIQRREVSIETPVSELLPPGVTVPTRDNQVITLGLLATHRSGLPFLPPSLHADSKDPYAGYTEDALYADLVHTALDFVPGTKLEYSNYGAGLLGVALGRKLGGGYAKVLAGRVLAPLGLADTYLTVPAAARARRATGTDADLAAVPPWTFDALAGAGALVSTARDQLVLLRDEIEAAGGSHEPLRAAMHYTQEDQLDDQQQSVNIGLGWQIDSQGRYWHNGGTAGFHCFIGFDPKAKRGIVLLASTGTGVLDRVADAMYEILDGGTPKPIALPSATELASFAGHYDFAGKTIAVSIVGKRVYVEPPGEPKIRMVPFGDHEFWIEQLQSLAVFQGDAAKISRVVFMINDRQIAAQRID